MTLGDSPKKPRIRVKEFKLVLHVIFIKNSILKWKLSSILYKHKFNSHPTVRFSNNQKLKSIFFSNSFSSLILHWNFHCRHYGGYILPPLLYRIYFQISNSGFHANYRKMGAPWNNFTKAFPFGPKVSNGGVTVNFLWDSVIWNEPWICAISF